MVILDYASSLACAVRLGAFGLGGADQLGEGGLQADVGRKEEPGDEEEGEGASLAEDLTCLWSSKEVSAGIHLKSPGVPEPEDQMEGGGGDVGEPDGDGPPVAQAVESAVGHSDRDGEPTGNAHDRLARAIIRVSERSSAIGLLRRRWRGSSKRVT